MLIFGLLSKTMRLNIWELIIQTQMVTGTLTNGHRFMNFKTLQQGITVDDLYGQYYQGPYLDSCR
jgi:hypothetical protein